jgi:hypothetical protein
MVKGKIVNDVSSPIPPARERGSEEAPAGFWRIAAYMEPREATKTYAPDGTKTYKGAFHFVNVPSEWTR